MISSSSISRILECVSFVLTGIVNNRWFSECVALQSEEANGFVNLRGAIVTESKRLPLAFEIQTGALFSERGMEKRVFTFTPVGAGVVLSRFVQAFCVESTIPALPLLLT
jgi:hypothetical protein